MALALLVLCFAPNAALIRMHFQLVLSASVRICEISALFCLALSRERNFGNFAIAVEVGSRRRQP
jgi:hypothetical protein